MMKADIYVDWNTLHDVHSCDEITADSWRRVISRNLSVTEMRSDLMRTDCFTGSPAETSRQ